MRTMADTKKRQLRCDVAVLVDVETGASDGVRGFRADAGSMESEVLRCLRAQHRRVEMVPFAIGIEDTIRHLRDINPRLVFNLTEWLDGDRRLDAAIAGMLDALKLRYTGTGPVGMHLARDKALSKAIVASLGITVPRHVVIDGRRMRTGDLAYPLIVKPQFGDGSDEIGRDSLVRTPRELARRVQAVRRRLRTPLLVEEYVPGRDLFVGLLGNKPRVLAPLELIVGRQGAGAPSIATSRIKTNAAYRARWKIAYRAAKLPPEVQRKVEQASARIFHALKLRDYARLDYRLTPDNELVFLEANPNPDLSPHTFGQNRCFAGVAYPDLIGGIVDAAMKRRAG
jgi:D-alanine-D-alanine ligase